MRPLRNSSHQHFQACDLSVSWFPEGPGVRHLVTRWRAGLSLLRVTIGLEPMTLGVEIRCSTIELYHSLRCKPTATCLAQGLHRLLTNRIPHAACLSPCGLLNRSSGQCAATSRLSPASPGLTAALGRKASNCTAPQLVSRGRAPPKGLTILPWTIALSGVAWTPMRLRAHWTSPIGSGPIPLRARNPPPSSIAPPSLMKRSVGAKALRR